MKTIIYFVENHSTNWPLIWHDCSPYLVLILILVLSLIIVKNENLTAKNKELLKCGRERDEKGHFLVVTGKGHGKKDWTTASKEELIKEAKRRYKKGDAIICLFDSDEVILINKDFDFTDSNELWASGERVNALIYFRGVWAKKVIK